MIVDQWDVVAVPFPFSDSAETKIRPALVLSKRTFNDCGHTVLAMITSAHHTQWPGDVLLDYQSAGLAQPCIIRLKLFTLDNQFLRSRIGKLAQKGRVRAAREFKLFLPL